MKLRIAFVVTSLGAGGAELMLLKLITALNKELFEPLVIVLAQRSPLADKLEKAGATVISLGARNSIFGVLAIAALVRATRAMRPRLIQGWMVHGNVAAAIVGWVLRLPVIWGVRHSQLLTGTEKLSTRLLEGLMARLSTIPVQIVYNSEQGRLSHQRLGYDTTRSVVVPNGFDLMEFAVDQDARHSFRTKYGIGPDGIAIGMVARYHPMKDHATFIAAAAILRRRRPEASFVLVGRGCGESNVALVDAVKEHGLWGSCLLLGERSDVRKIQRL
jgi:glycosyltransferase involved in cell wall biosynthesis